MKLAAARALAACVSRSELGEEYIIPGVNRAVARVPKGSRAPAHETPLARRRRRLDFSGDPVTLLVDRHPGSRHAARARAAASFISSLTARARASSRAPEEPGEAKHVIDLVRIVGAPRRHDSNVLCGRFRTYLGLRIGHGEDDRVARHPLQSRTVKIPGTERPMNTSAPSSAGGETPPDLTRVGGGADPSLHEVHALCPVAVDRAVLVDRR